MSNTSKDILDVAFIGCGAIAQKKHLPALSCIKNVRICAFYDTNPINAEAALQQYGAAEAVICRELKDLLEMPHIDAVYICTPNNTHASYAIAALEHGKHVLCEKPMAISSQEGQMMVEAAEKSGKILTIAYQNRFSKEAIYLKSLKESGFFGEIYHIKAFAVRKRAVPAWNPYLYSAAQGGGPLIDIGTHSIDLGLWISGNYEPLYAVGMTYNMIGKKGSKANRWGEWNNNDFTVEDSAFGFVVMKNGMTLTVDTAWAMNVSEEKEASVSIFGDCGGAEMNSGLRLTTEYNGILCNTEPQLDYSQKQRLLSPGVSAQLPGQMESQAFIDAVLSGQSPAVKASEALVVTRIIEGIYQSSQSRKPYYF